MALNISASAGLIPVTSNKSSGSMPASTRVLKPAPSDILIAVVGTTGAGKSTLISKLVDGNVGVGHNLTSCTSEVGLYSMTFNHNNLPRRVVLIDTPGFDDINRSDSDVLQDITFILSQTYEQGMKLTGIIYLHRITDVRMSGSALKNLTMFKKLCGENFYDHVVLATTMWGNLVANRNGIDTGIAREKELIETKNWWGLMCNRGIALGSAATLDIQREMVDEKKILADTSAGQEIQKELQEQQRKHDKERLELITAREKALKDKDHELAEELLKERQESNKKLLAMERAQQELVLDFQHLKADRETHHGQMLKLQEKLLEAKLSEDPGRWEQKSREDKRALEDLASKFQEERWRREYESLESRRAMAAMDEQSRQERQRLEQVIAESQKAQITRDSERNSEVMRLRGMLEKQQAASNSKVAKLQEKLEELQSASKKASDVVRRSGSGGMSPSTVKYTSLSLGCERSVVYVGFPPLSRDLHRYPPEGPENDRSPFYGPRHDDYDEEDGRYHHYERNAYSYNHGEGEYAYHDGGNGNYSNHDGNGNYHDNDDRGDHYDGRGDGDRYDGGNDGDYYDRGDNGDHYDGGGDGDHYDGGDDGDYYDGGDDGAYDDGGDDGGDDGDYYDDD